MLLTLVFVLLGTVASSLGSEILEAHHKRSETGWQKYGTLQPGQWQGRAVTLSDGDVLRCGGQSAVVGGTGTGNDCHLLGHAPLAFRDAAPMAVPMDSFLMERLSNGKVLAFAGSYASTPFPLAETQLYDPASNTWTQLGDIALRFPKTGAYAVQHNGLVMLCGGQVFFDTLSSCEVFNPTDSTWSLTTSLPEGRLQHSMTTLLNGKVLLCGGSPPGGVFNPVAALKSCMVFDPFNDLWTSVADMNVARSEFVMALLPDGDVLVAGGRNIGSFIGSVEIYNAASNTWQVQSGAIVPRYGMESVVTSTGVMIVGGLLNPSLTSASCEIVDFATRSVSVCAEISPSRAQHSLVRLGPSLVTVWGGQELSYTSGFTGINTVEIYGLSDAATTAPGTTSSGSTSSGTTSSGTTSSGTTSSGTTFFGSIGSTGAVPVITKEAQVGARYFWQAPGGNAWMQGEFGANGVPSGTPVVVSTVPYRTGLADDTLKARDARFVRTRLAKDTVSSSLYLGRFTGGVVPSHATITGVKLVLTRSSSREGLRDVSMQLVIGGNAVASSERFGPSGSSYWPVSETNSKIGGPGDMWGLSSVELRPDVVNSPNFGVMLATKNFHRLNSTDGFIGEVSMYFTYTIPAVVSNIDDEMLVEPVGDEAVVLPSAAMGSIVAAVVVVVVAIAVVAVIVTRRHLVKNRKAADVPMVSNLDDVSVAVGFGDVPLSPSANPLFQADV